jgi:hypothetical protein
MTGRPTSSGRAHWRRWRRRPTASGGAGGGCAAPSATAIARPSPRLLESVTEVVRIEDAAL